MKVVIKKDQQEMGLFAAQECARRLREAIVRQGEARLILATGASQFEVLKALCQQEVDWTKVTMFHLDEYVNLPESHAASFRRYLKERFVSHVRLKAAHFVNGEGDVGKNIAELTVLLRQAPVDVAMIGIGETRISPSMIRLLISIPEPPISLSIWMRNAECSRSVKDGLHLLKMCRNRPFP